MSQIELFGNQSPFDAIKRIEDGIEVWYGRDLMPLLEYTRWSDFEPVIKRAMISCQNTGNTLSEHFSGISLKSTGGRSASDWRTTRLGAYLTSMNGDPSKSGVAAAQAYFAIRTHQAEQYLQAPPEVDRLKELELQVRLAEVNARVRIAEIDLEREKLHLSASQPKQTPKEPTPTKRPTEKKTAKQIIKELPPEPPPSCRIKIQGDPMVALQQFVDECLEITLNWGDRLTNEEIHQAYVEYCEATYSPQHGYPRFVSKLKDLVPECHQPRRRKTASEDSDSGRSWVPAHWVKLKIKAHPRVMAG